MRSVRGQVDASHCVCKHVRLTGNLEHVIRRVVLLNSACVSGTKAGAVELHRLDNPYPDSVCEHVN